MSNKKPPPWSKFRAFFIGPPLDTPKGFVNMEEYHACVKEVDESYKKHFIKCEKTKIEEFAELSREFTIIAEKHSVTQDPELLKKMNELTAHMMKLDYHS